MRTAHLEAASLHLEGGGYTSPRALAPWLRAALEARAELLFDWTSALGVDDRETPRPGGFGATGAQTAVRDALGAYDALAIDLSAMVARSGAALASCIAMSEPFALLPFPLPPDQAAAIAQAYATPPRAYHDLHHVGEVLRHYDDVAHGPGWVHPREVASCGAVPRRDLRRRSRRTTKRVRRSWRANSSRNGRWTGSTSIASRN